MHRMRAAIAVLSSSLLASCMTAPLQIPTLGLSTPTQPVKPLVCSEMQVVHYSNGKPGVSKADITAALQLPDEIAISHIRNLLGDTAPTQAQVQDNNCTFDRLCGIVNPTCSDGTAAK